MKQTNLFVMEPLVQASGPNAVDTWDNNTMYLEVRKSLSELGTMEDIIMHGRAQVGAMLAVLNSGNLSDNARTCFLEIVGVRRGGCAAAVGVGRRVVGLRDAGQPSWARRHHGRGLTVSLEEIFWDHFFKLDKNYHSTKTGSGQTQEDNSKNTTSFEQDALHRAAALAAASRHHH